MAAPAAKQDVFDKAVKQLLKKYPAPPPPDPRPVLEELIYGLCREGATTAQADNAFAALKDDFFDWNEVRVSTVQEVATALKGLPNAGSKAKRLVEFLQELFELDYNFSLEGIEKKGLKHAAKQLGRYQGMTDFIVAWVTQRSLGGHAVPLDEASIRVLRHLELIPDEDEDDVEALRDRIEHHVSKSECYAVTEALAEMAADTRAMPKKESAAKKPDPLKPKPKPKAK